MNEVMEGAAHDASKGVDVRAQEPSENKILAKKVPATTFRGGRGRGR